jgi:hypothetical protein
MKLFKIIAIVIVCGIFGVILVSIALHIVVNQHSEMTESQIAAMFEKVGGANKVNQEAKDIFTQFGTSEVTLLTKSNLNNFPSISALGKSVVLYPESIDAGKFPPHIEVKFGSHFNGKTIFIFETNNVVQFRNDSRLFEVSPSIYVGK